MRRIIPIILSCILFGAMFVTFHGTASASSHMPNLTPTCSGNGCNNTDPFATHCTDLNLDGAYAVTNINIITPNVSGGVYLMYSTICKTNFTIVSTSPAVTTYMYAQINRASGPDGGSLSYNYSSSQFTWINTNQVYSPNNQAQACGAFTGSGVQCTGLI